MYFELQLSAAAFTHIVRNRLKALPLCIDREIKDTDGVTLLVVDRIVIGESTWVQRERKVEFVNNLPKPADSATQMVWIFSPTNYTSYTVPYLQVKQEVHIHMVKTSDLEANGPNPTPTFKTLTVYPVFNVALTASMQTQRGGPLRLSYSLAYIDFGFLYLALSDAVRANIQQFASAIQLPPMELDLKALKSALRREVSAINAGIVCDPAGTFVALRVDFDVYNSPIAVLPQFFQEPPEDIRGGRDWAMLVDSHMVVADARALALKALSSDSKIRLGSGPDVSWDPSGPAVDIHAGVELVDACPFFVDNIDMDVDVEARISLSVPTPNTLRSHFHLTGSPGDIGEEIACAVTGALLWPLLGPAFLKDEDALEGVAIYFAGLYTGWIPVFIGLIAAMETKTLSKDLSKDLGNNCTKQDDENYECNDVLNLVMELVPPFNSRLEVEAVQGNLRGPVLSGSISNLRDLSLGSVNLVQVCPFVWQVVGRCTGNGKSNFRVANQATISVYAVPPAGMCFAYVMSDPEQEFALTSDGTSVTIIPRFRPSYVANPYPCRVRLITNRGVRTLTLDPPAALGDEERERLEKERLGAHLQCYYWEKIATPIEQIRWIPDPPFERRFVQFWQIAVRGLQADESIVIHRREGSTVMSAKASRAGIAHMTLLFPGEDAPSELLLELRSGRAKTGYSREITVQQVLFQHTASIGLDGPVRAMRFEGSARNRRLIVRNDEGEMIWQITGAVIPTLLSSLAVEAEDYGHAMVVHSGKRVGPAPSANIIRAVEVLKRKVGQPEAVGTPRVGGVREALYLRTRSSAVLYDISVPEEPREMQFFNMPGWFEFVALGGDIIAKYDANTRRIELFTAVRQKACV